MGRRKSSTKKTIKKKTLKRIRKKQMKKLEKLVKIAKNPNFKGAPLKAIDDYQRALNIQIEKAMSVGGNAAEGRALNRRVEASVEAQAK